LLTPCKTRRSFFKEQVQGQFPPFDCQTWVMKKIFEICVGVILMALCGSVSAASLQKATMYNEHGLRAEAKQELIDVIFSKASQNDKAEAYYLLGSIAFDERSISVALDSWKTLVAKYPKSKEATLLKEKYRNSQR